MADESPSSRGILVFVSGSLEADAPSVSDLQSGGYEVTCCHDPAVAAKIFETKPRGWLPDLFIVDVIIPRMSGFELVRRISTTYSRYAIPIVMMSRHAMAEDVTEAHAAGAVGLLKKPVTAAMIEATLAKIRSGQTK